MLDRLELAFSRDGPRKDYVQHHVRKHARAMWALVQRGAHVFVCGGTAMGADVRAKFVEVAQAEGRMQEPQAKARALVARAVPAYPPSSREEAPRSSTERAPASFEGRCHWCNVEGHRMSQCWKAAPRSNSL